MWAVFKRRVAEPLPWPRPLLALLSGLCSRNYWTARPEARTAHGPANTHSEEEAAPRHTPPQLVPGVATSLCPYGVFT